ncbi:MAG: hydrolase [Nocardioides sp.]|jgi:8-oxo-dGTP diphosphatase|uniref:NUDIX hydrolase n=1 Tax=Nocardioides sp. TaxID=35761 RepID=UPI002616E7D3|nr:NUDIX domain-containing protein [Nocardioides sp.]MCW2835473.1 hydrolase [Nocardioides sp.]
MPHSDESIPTDLEFHEYDTRLAAYAVIVDTEHAQDRVLLSWWNGEGHGEPGWSLPGGGVDLPETAEQGAIREAREETGFDVELTGLLGVDSHVVSPGERVIDTGRWQRSLRILFSARVVGGSLGTLEVNGSTDYAQWVPIASVPDLPRAGIVDVGLAAFRGRGV